MGWQLPPQSFIPLGHVGAPPTSPQAGINAEDGVTGPSRANRATLRSSTLAHPMGKDALPGPEPEYSTAPPQRPSGMQHPPKDTVAKYGGQQVVITRSATTGQAGSSGTDSPPSHATFGGVPPVPASPAPRAPPDARALVPPVAVAPPAPSVPPRAVAACMHLRREQDVSPQQQ